MKSGRSSDVDAQGQGQTSPRLILCPGLPSVERGLLRAGRHPRLGVGSLRGAESSPGESHAGLAAAPACPLSLGRRAAAGWHPPSHRRGRKRKRTGNGSLVALGFPRGRPNLPAVPETDVRLAQLCAAACGPLGGTCGPLCAVQACPGGLGASLGGEPSCGVHSNSRSLAKVPGPSSACSPLERTGLGLLTTCNARGVKDRRGEGAGGDEGHEIR